MSETALRMAGDTYRRNAAREHEQERSEHREIEVANYNDEVERRQEAEARELARLRELLESDPLQVLRETFADKGMTCEHEIPAPKKETNLEVGRRLFAYPNGRGRHEDFMMTYQGGEHVALGGDSTAQRLRHIFYIGDEGSYFRLPDHIRFSQGGIISLEHARLMAQGLQELTR